MPFLKIDEPSGHGTYLYHLKPPTYGSTINDLGGGGRGKFENEFIFPRKSLSKCFFPGGGFKIFFPRFPPPPIINGRPLTGSQQYHHRPSLLVFVFIYMTAGSELCL